MKPYKKFVEEISGDPCWDGYRQEGMKKKGDRMVPNCVPMTEERRDGEVWETGGGWAAQARGVTDYFDSREGAEAYAKGYSRQNRAAYTKTGKQKITNPPRSSGGPTLGGDLVREDSQLTEKKIGGTMRGHAGIDFGDAMPTFTKGAQSVARTITRLRRKPGDVWDTHLGEWGAKSPSGEIRYFKKEFDAKYWARTGTDINASK